MQRLPTVFVSHGSPMLALDAGAAGSAWQQLAEQLPRPRAVVAVSAHWSAALPTLGNGAHHATIHDFYGFPAALYQVQYRTPGDPQLAESLQQRLSAARLDPERGLDHGAWVPLSSMYAAADVPVVPLSLNARLGPAHHYALGEALAPLLADDVLLLASGGLTHNLREFRPGADGLPPPDYVLEFQDWFYQRIQAGDIDALLDYRQRAPGAVRAHPTEEHLLPIFVALGAAGTGAQATRHYAAISERILAMDAYSFSRS